MLLAVFSIIDQSIYRQVKTGKRNMQTQVKIMPFNQTGQSTTRNENHINLKCMESGGFEQIY